MNSPHGVRVFSRSQRLAFAGCPWNSCPVVTLTPRLSAWTGQTWARMYTRPATSRHSLSCIMTMVSPRSSKGVSKVSLWMCTGIWEICQIQQRSKYNAGFTCISIRYMQIYMYLWWHKQILNIIWNAIYSTTPQCIQKSNQSFQEGGGLCSMIII